MNRKWFSTLGLLAIGFVAFAAPTCAQSDQREVTVGRSSFTAVSVGTSAVQIDNTARKLDSRSAIGIQNMSTTAIVYCSTNSGVNAANGWAVFPRESFVFTIPDAQSLYCISDTASTDVRVAQVG